MSSRSSEWLVTSPTATDADGTADVETTFAAGAVKTGPQNTRIPNDPTATMSGSPSWSTSATATLVTPVRGMNCGGPKPGELAVSTLVNTSIPPETGITTSLF